MQRCAFPRSFEIILEKWTRNRESKNIPIRNNQNDGQVLHYLSLRKIEPDWFQRREGEEERRGERTNECVEIENVRRVGE